MDPRWATKDHYERDTDETNRLVRPSPKVKPPRRDKRREHTHPDADPDTDLDPDVARDPDLSMNYKTIGGSLAERVAASFVFAEAGKVKVRRKKDKRIVEVTREHLNENSGEYEGVDKDEEGAEDNEAGPKKKPEEESKQPRGWVDERFVQEDTGPKKKEPEEGEQEPKRKKEEAELKQLKDFNEKLEDNLGLQSFARSLLDPDSEMGNWPNDAPLHDVFIKKHPDLAVAKAKNFGELRQFINRAKNLPKFEEKLQEKWKKEDAQGKKPNERVKDKFEQSQKPPSEEKGEAPPAEGKKPDEEKKAPEQPKANPLAERGQQIRELAKNSLPLQQAIQDIDKGSKDVHNLKPDKEDASSLFQGIPNAPQGLTYGDLRQSLEATRPKEEGKGEEPKESPPEGDEPEADAPGEAPTAPGAPPGEPVPPPEGKGKKPKKPKEGNPEVDEFVKSKGFSEPDFRNWADKDERVRKSKDGEMLFPDIESKTHVPFEKLPDKAKLDWVRRYKGQKRHTQNISALTDLASTDSRVGDVLKQLANPNSPLSTALAKKKDLDFVDARKAIPELQDVELPPSVDSVADLVRAAQEIHKRPAPPERPQVSQAERQQMISQLISKVPASTIKSMLDAGFGPQDVDRFASTYEVAKQGELGEKDFAEFARMAARGYETDPNNVSAPKMVRRGDQLVPFSSLSHEEQSEAYRAHQIRTVALSMGARHKLTHALSEATGAPDKLTGSLVDFSLTQKPDANPEHREAAARHAAHKLFEETLSSDDDKPVSDSRMQKILKLTEGDPAAQKIATAYFQGKDYTEARRRFLDSESDEAITERSDPKSIVRGIGEAEQFFRDQADRYPPGAVTLEPQAVFRTRVMNRLRILSPEKMPIVEAHLEKQDADRYDRDQYKHEKAYSKWEREEAPRAEKSKKEYGKAFKKYLDENAKYEAKKERLLRQTPNAKDPYRGDVDFIEKSLGKPPQMPAPPEDEPPPVPPKKPVGYDRVRGNGRKDDNEQKRLWQEQFEGVGEMPESAVKVAFRYAQVRVSSYPMRWAMGESSGQGKSAVYWGVEPYPKGSEGPPPSTQWTQIHQRDITESDLTGILTAAREWLKTPVLSSSVEGIVRDTQLRAALDLAIRSHEEGRFSVGLMPPVYNDLLARLAGKSTSETLLTVREATSQAVQKTTNSLYVATGDKVPMKASAHIRAFAKRVASENSALAFDLVELADKLAGEEQQQQAGQQQQQQSGQQQQQQAGQVPPQFLEHMKGKGEGKEEGQGQDQGQQKDASYKALRSAVIRTAAANPNLRAAFLPLLAEVKKLG